MTTPTPDRPDRRAAKPARIQRKRTAGWRMPSGARYVGRPTRFGNPFRVVYRPSTGGWHAEHDTGGSVGTWPNRTGAAEFAVESHRQYLRDHPDLVARIRRELPGLDLACWCALGDPCHVDTLLAVAAGEAP